MKKLRPLLRDPKRVRRMVFLWIPIFSLLLGGCQQFNEFAAESGYCWSLRYRMLDDYYEKHHCWPASLQDIERDQLGRADLLGYWNVRWFYYEYRPVMTILREDKTGILIRVQFTGWYHRADNVDSGDDESRSRKMKRACQSNTAKEAFNRRLSNADYVGFGREYSLKAAFLRLTLESPLS